VGERQSYQVGDRVLHAEFGEGLVVEVRERLFYDILEVVFPGGVKRVSSIHPRLSRPEAPSDAPAVGTVAARRKPRREDTARAVTKSLRVPRERLSGIDYVTLEPESWSVVESLRAPSLDGIEPYRLHLKAAEHSLRRGFDQLVSMDHLHEIERFPYQIRACLRVLREMKGRSLLADEVGLGKTIEASIVLKEYIMRGLVHRALILVPASLTTQWREELLNKAHLNFTVHGRREGWSDAPFVIASLDTAKMTRNRDLILKGRYDLVIVDEAHRLRNHQTLAWKFVSQVSARYLLLLTATPVQNDLRELYNLVTLLRPGTLGTYRSFRRRFMVRGDKRLPKNTTELSQLLQKVMIRTTRSNAALDFPKRRVRTMTFPLNEAERALYDGVTEFVRRRVAGARGADFPRWHFVAMVLQKEIGSSVAAAVKTLERARDDVRYRAEWEEIDGLLTLARAAGDGAKLAGLREVLHRVPDKVIVFTQFRSTLEYLARNLRADGQHVAVFHGNLTAAEKEAAIEEFRERARILVSTEAGGEGRNLQFCQTIVNYDLPWNPMKVEQRIGRVHRLGQTRDIMIYNFASEETVESYVLEILHKKINMFELVIGEMDMILGHFSEENTFEDTVFKIWSGSKGLPEVRRRFGELGERLLVARKRYEEIKEMDARIFDTDDADR
jgi:SNF2 family DNA or RNA helicase